jgi:hypothetical protein
MSLMCAGQSRAIMLESVAPETSTLIRTYYANKTSVDGNPLWEARLPSKKSSCCAAINHLTDYECGRRTHRTVDYATATLCLDDHGRLSASAGATVVPIFQRLGDAAHDISAGDVGSPSDSINRFAQLKKAAPLMTSTISKSSRPAACRL